MWCVCDICYPKYRVITRNLLLAHANANVCRVPVSQCITHRCVCALLKQYLLCAVRISLFALVDGFQLGFGYIYIYIYSYIYRIKDHKSYSIIIFFPLSFGLFLFALCCWTRKSWTKTICHSHCYGTAKATRNIINLYTHREKERNRESEQSREENYKHSTSSIEQIIKRHKPNHK